MRFRTKHPVTTLEARRNHAAALGRLVNSHEMAPYMPNDGQETFWRIHDDNDWIVLFFDDKPDEFVLRYRYNSAANDRESALAPWLKARWEWEVIGEASVAGPFAPKVVLP